MAAAPMDRARERPLKRGLRIAGLAAAAGAACSATWGRGTASTAAASAAGTAFVSGEGGAVSDYGTAALAVGLSVFYALSWQRSKALGETEATTAEAAVTEGAKKPRIDSFDSLRFFLIFYIASGHFIATATSNAVLLRAASQINVVVGAFFVLSGYVAAYTTTELGQRMGSKRLDNSVEFAVTRIMGFWPLHLFVLVCFLPMFFWVDMSFNGAPVALWNGFLSVFLLQSWFPLSAEVWNAPTWFLSAFAFALFGLCYALRVLATLKKAELRKAMVFLTLVALVPRLSYSYDLKAWEIFEGTLSARTHPNYALFNALRFSPFAALLEVVMGAVACRLVMLDSGKPGENTGSSFPILLTLLSIIGLRAMGIIELNDMLVRSLAFIPLWCVFLMRIHRETVAKSAMLPRLLCSPRLLYMGGISFPIFIVHGPIGQLMYKKAVAMKVWGQVLANPQPHGVDWFFGVYWLAVILAAACLDKFFLQSKQVKEFSKNTGTAICKLIG